MSELETGGSSVAFDEGNPNGELESFELKAGRVSGASSPSASIAEEGGGKGQESGDGVQGGGLGVATSASNQNGVVESAGGLVGEALPDRANGRRHHRRTYKRVYVY